MHWFGTQFGVSTNLDAICGLLGAERLSDHFKFNLHQRLPGLLFVVGSIIGGWIAVQFLSASDFSVAISEKTMADIEALGVSYNTGLLPNQLFSLSSLATSSGFILLVFGGFMVGFGTRYAGGCTSGHAISGLSNLQVPSLLAAIGFFAGGLAATHFLLPILLQP